MRLRTESDGARSNGHPERGGRAAGGGRFRLPRFFGGHRGNNSDGSATSTDASGAATVSPKEEEPRNVVLSFREMLEVQHFYEAGQLLIERERRLFGDTLEAVSLKNHDEEVQMLVVDYEHLKELVLQTVRQSLSPGEFNPEALTSAVRAIKQEVERDQEWTQADRKLPSWRSNNDWKVEHDAALHSLVDQLMDSPSQSSPIQRIQSTVQRDVNNMGRQLKDDLLWVVDCVKSCYPPEMDICNFYARLYHQSFSARLTKIADFVLGDKDCTFLLMWVNEYYPNILQKPELAAEIDGAALGTLLPEEMLESLKDDYLSKRQEELSEYISRILSEARQKWESGEQPPMEDGCFVSPVAYDIIQFINGMVTSAVRVVGEQQKAQNITSQLPDLMKRFSSFQTDIMKQNRPNSKAFIKANLGSLHQFSDVLQRKSDLFPKHVREDCLLVVSDMRESAHAYLLKPVHEVLKPQYRKLGSSDWLKKQVFENLLLSIEQELQDLQGTTQSAHQKLIGRLHQEVTVEYVRRLLKGEKLKDKALQLKAYETMTSNAESLHTLFVTMGSSQHWLKEVLHKIAEVLKLQDLPAIQMQVASLGTTFPDLNERHVSALLKLKSNVSRAERRIVKDTLSETLREISGDASHKFFSLVQVK
ncbi:uncharacterized protein V6R79_012248 [Siganus canaliculatus]